MTLRETIEAKIAASEAELVSLKADLEKLSPMAFIDQEVTTISEWFKAVAKHVGL